MEQLNNEVVGGFRKDGWFERSGAGIHCMKRHERDRSSERVACRGNARSPRQENPHAYRERVV